MPRQMCWNWKLPETFNSSISRFFYFWKILLHTYSASLYKGHVAPSLEYRIIIIRSKLQQSEGTIYSRYFECISVMFPVTFLVTFHFRLHNSDTSIGSQSVHRSDLS